MHTYKNRAALMAAAMVTIVAGGGPGAIHAEDNTDEQLLACDRIVEMAEKMECFAAVVNRLKHDDEPTKAESQPARSPDSPTTAATPPDAAVVKTTSKNPPAAAVSDAATLPATTVVTDVADSTEVSQDAAIDDFGREDLKATEQKAARRKEVKAKRDDVESIHATIVEAWPTADHRFEVRLDNGQVWRETALTRRSNRLPKKGSPVRITKGRLGSYNMKIGSDNRLAAVRRTK